jgi:hypothetical protein
VCSSSKQLHASLQLTMDQPSPATSPPSLATLKLVPSAPSTPVSTVIVVRDVILAIMVATAQIPP